MLAGRWVVVGALYTRLVSAFCTPVPWCCIVLYGGIYATAWSFPAASGACQFCPSVRFCVCEVLCGLGGWPDARRAWSPCISAVCARTRLLCVWWWCCVGVRVCDVCCVRQVSICVVDAAPRWCGCVIPLGIPAEAPLRWVCWRGVVVLLAAATAVLGCRERPPSDRLSSCCVKWRK